MKRGLKKALLSLRDLVSIFFIFPSAEALGYYRDAPTGRVR